MTQLAAPRMAYNIDGTMNENSLIRLMYGVSYSVDRRQG